MKKHMLSFSILLTVTLFLFSCSSNNMVTVQLNLGLGNANAQNSSLIEKLFNLFTKRAYAAPPTDVTSIHIAVFEGSTNVNNLLATYTAAPADVVEIEVPAGINRIFLIVGAANGGNMDIARYAGESAQYDLVPNSNANVSINVQTINIPSNTVTYQDLGNSGIERWGSVIGADKYLIVGGECSGNFDTIPAECLTPEFTTTSFRNYFNVNAVFSYFGLRTSAIQIMGFGCNF
jgi:hypothetical protein